MADQITSDTEQGGTESAERLPCPFDGGEAYVQSYEGRFFVGCMTCFCAVGEAYDNSAMPEHMFHTEADAIAAWNHRAVLADKSPQKDKLYELVEKFIRDQKISCEEAVYQTDRVIENAYEFIESACKIVGYYEYPEGE